MIASRTASVSTRGQASYATILTTQFERVAEVVVGRVAELLCAEVTVLDDANVVVASGARHMVGRHFDVDSQAAERPFLRIPIHLDGQSGAVIVGETLNGEVFSPRLAHMLVQLVVGQALALDRLPDRRERKNAFIRDLLEGAIGDEASVLREASVLGMDLATPRTVVLIDAADYILGSSQQSGDEVAAAGMLQRAELVICNVVSFFHLPNDTICAYIGDGEIAVLKASNTRNLVPWVGPSGAAATESCAWANLAALKRACEGLLQHLQADIGASINLGVGRYHPGMCGIAYSYQDARAALSIGRRLFGQNRVHCLDSLGIGAFVGISDERTKIDLAAHLLSPLDHEPELIDTLDTFFVCNCCPSTSASRLSIHRNTLGYRLQKIASLTGLDPRRFEEAMQIHLALLMRAFHTST